MKIPSFFIPVCLSFSTFISQSTAVQTYFLDSNFAGHTFFNYFDFQTSTDLNHGYVQYLSQQDATNRGLIYAADNAPMRMSVDAVSVLSGTPGTGRRSVRITSKKSWTHGLFIADIKSMPTPACGIWPAFWMYGPNWPSNGEIDIMEGVSLNKRNTMTLHTAAGCTVKPQVQFGTLQSGQCFGGANNNAGCSIQGNNDLTYGNGFNSVGGGVYATEWTSSYIKIWHFARNNGIPSDITSGKPNPALWGTPHAYFQGSSTCNIDSKFAANKIVINTNFCGDWAGDQGLWNSDPVCRTKAPSCVAYVAKNPTAFAGANWLINSIKVYQLGGTKRDALEDPAGETVEEDIWVRDSLVEEPLVETVDTPEAEGEREGEELVPPDINETVAKEPGHLHRHKYRHRSGHVKK